MADDAVARPTPEMLLDAGINWWAGEMLIESLRKKADFDALTDEKPFTFAVRGAKFRISFDPASNQDERDDRKRQGLPERNPHYAPETTPAAEGA